MGIVLFCSGVASAATVRIEPGTFGGSYLVDGQRSVGASTNELAVGGHVVSLGGYNSFTISVASDGALAVSDSTKASSTGNTVSFINHPITIAPGTYQGTWIVGVQLGWQTGPQALDLVAGRYMLNVGAYNGMFLDVAPDGSVSTSEPTKAAVSGATLSLITMPVTFDPADYLGWFALERASAWTTGIATLALPPGRYRLAVGGHTATFVDVAADGSVQVVDPTKATTAGSTLRFVTTHFTIDPDRYTGEFALEYGSAWRHGVTTLAVVPGRYNVGAGGYTAFFVDIANDGSTTTIDPTKATTNGSTVTFLTHSVAIDPAAYRGYFGVEHVGSAFSQLTHLDLVRGRYRLAIGVNSMIFEVGADDTMTSLDPTKAIGAGSVLTFVTVPITIDPGAYAGTWWLWESHPLVNGVRELELVPGPYWLARNNQAATFLVSAPCGVAPASLIVDGTAFLLSCTEQAPSNDTTQPVVALVAPPTIINSAQLQIAGVVTDDTGVTSAVFLVNGVATPPLEIGSTGAVAATVELVEGINTIVLRATDAAGNVASTSTQVVLDTVPPDLVIASPTANQAVSSSPVPVTVMVGDATATMVSIGDMAFAIEAGGGRVSAEVPLEGDGDHVVGVSAVDAAGNVSTTSFVVFLDTTAPVLETDIAEGAIVGELGDAMLPVVLRVDAVGATTTTLSSGETYDLPRGGGLIQSLIPMTEGPVTFTFTVVDEAGHVAVLTRTITYDTTAPTIALASPTHGAAVAGRIEIAATVVDDGGVELVDFRLDGIAVPTARDGALWTAMLDTSIVLDGPHDLSIAAQDRAGNLASYSTSFVVDNSSPTVTFLSPGTDAPVSGTIAISVDATDPTSGVAAIEISVDGNPLGTCATSPCTVDFDTSGLPDGTFTISASALDHAGNQSEPVQVHPTSDNSAPRDFLISPRPGDVVRGDFDLRISIVDANFESVACTVDGALVASSTDPALSVTVSTASRLDGRSEVRCVATDAAGNVGIAIASITIANWTMKVAPATINLKSKGGDKSVTMVVEGANVAQLLPLVDELVVAVPGGTRVPVTPFSGSTSLVDDDHDGVPELELKIDRQALAATIRASLGSHALAAGEPFPVTLFRGTRALGEGRMTALP